MHLACEAALLLRAPEARLLTPALLQTVLRRQCRWPPLRPHGRLLVPRLLEVMHTVAYAWARHTHRALNYTIWLGMADENTNGS